MDHLRPQKGNKLFRAHLFCKRGFLYKLMPTIQSGQHVSGRYAQTDATISLPPSKNLVVVSLKMVMQHDLRPSRPTIQHTPAT
jgi:hypothetical protein